jgi:hypothetical protein
MLVSNPFGVMRPAADWDEAYLTRLINVKERESLTLDYKASGALKNQNKEKNDIGRDVSAFANSAGGYLVYGMLENKHESTKLDVGVDRNVITKEWFESIINSYIHPAMDDLIIKQIELESKGPDMVAYVVEVPQVTSRAPHQAKDHRYYKRSNFESKPMEDYEVRDAMRRSIDYGRKYGTAWDLNMEVRCLISAAREPEWFGGTIYVARNTLIIGVSGTLRSAGSAMILLRKSVREDVATLVNLVDEYNSIVETVDQGQEVTRVSTPLRDHLCKLQQLGQHISTALSEILDNEP